MTKILNLKQYELVFTTSFFYTHGVSGHLYEMIDYCYTSRAAGINSAILLADGVTKSLFETAVRDKYNFSESELTDLLDNTIECHRPLIMMTNNLCLVDGSWRVLDCTIYAQNVFLLRCSEDDFSYFTQHKTIKRTHLMQDFNLYPERFEGDNIEVVDYVKKILWQKYHQPRDVLTNTALLYLTTNCRALSVAEVQQVLDKYDFDHYLIVTNEPEIYANQFKPNVRIVQAPVRNVFEQFDTYIYTSTPKKADCSPRFIVECAAFNKQVVYEIDYLDKGIECRKKMMEADLNSLLLTVDDLFITYVKEHIDAKG